MNHSQSELKSLFSWSPIVLEFLPMKKKQVSSAYDSNSELTACGISFTCKKKRRGGGGLTLEEHHKLTFHEMKALFLH